MAKIEKHTAQDAFIARKNEIDALLARITAASENHFGANPDAIHWGDTGSLDHAASKLRDLAEFLGA